MLPQRRADRLFDDFVDEYLEAERVRMRSFASAERHGRRWIRFREDVRSILPSTSSGGRSAQATRRP
jgi:hypothetical protein